MKHYEIDTTVDDLVSVFTEAGYTEKSITELRRNIEKVVTLHRDNRKRVFDPNLIESYISQTREKYALGSISRSRRNALIKAALYVQEIASTGTVLVGARTQIETLPPQYRKLIEDLRKSDKWSAALNRNIVYAAHTYLLFLVDSGILDIGNITEEVIREYIVQKAAAISPNSLNTIRRNLKHFHQWLYENTYLRSDFSDVLSFTTPSIHRIHKPVPQDEVALMLQSINRESPIGKRNYAMFMIAVVTGMRGVDIANLKLSDIDWINGEIQIVQKKTGAVLALPLTTDVGEALKDYILYGRPKSDLDAIFLSSRPPFRQLGRRVIYSEFNRARLHIGLKKCPLHGLRRAVGTNMVVAGVPVTTVAQVLGHADISSTKQYISLDSAHLRECALGLEGIARSKGEL